MKKFILGIASAALLASCGASDHGELVGVQNRPSYYPHEPYGMVYIPQGSFTMGNHDQDVPTAYNAPAQVVSVPSFFMDQTEITNNEYRQFVRWVRDSILRFRLAEGMVEGYSYYDLSELEDPTPYQEYIALNYPDSMTRRLDWDPYLEWSTDRYPDAEYTEVVESMYLPAEEQWMGYHHIDTRQLNYTFFWINKQKAASKLNRVEYDFKDANGDGEIFSYRDYIKDTQRSSNRASFFEKETINVYPDTLVWIHDFTYSFNEPMHDKYFWHPAYDDYPVVGVNCQR